MKKPVAAAVLLSLFLFALQAAPYVGISQGILSTSMELGFLTRSIDQNLVVSLPLVGALDSGDDWYRYPVASMNILYKKQFGTVLALGVGPTLRMGWEYGKAVCLQAGIALQFSLEAEGVMDILFCELSYLPKALTLLQGTASSTLLEKGTGQCIRFGYRHAF